jgi:hypothetical protein
VTIFTASTFQLNIGPTDQAGSSGVCSKTLQRAWRNDGAYVQLAEERDGASGKRMLRRVMHRPSHFSLTARGWGGQSPLEIGRGSADPVDVHDSPVTSETGELNVDANPRQGERPDPGRLPLMTTGKAKTATQTAAATAVEPLPAHVPLSTELPAHVVERLTNEGKIRVRDCDVPKTRSVGFWRRSVRRSSRWRRCDCQQQRRDGALHSRRPA